MAVKFLVVLILAITFEEVFSHGRMMDPINRSSIWRINSSFPVNYQDNQLFCGGYAVQFEKNHGRCGVCGDDFQQKRPRDNENTGKFGLGRMVRSYGSGSTIEVATDLTANHLGYFQYSLCALSHPDELEEENCFVPLLFEDGNDRYYLGTQRGMIYSKLLVPQGLHCQHCVLRWQYTAGNNWGLCDNFVGALGCGSQETFRNCADVSIL